MLTYEFSEAIDDLLSHYAVYVDNDEVWESAREYQDMPVFENIYLDIAFYKLMQKLINEIGFLEEDDFRWYINHHDSHFYIVVQGEYISLGCEYERFDECVAETLSMNLEDQEDFICHFYENWIVS